MARKCFVIMPMTRTGKISPDEWNSVFDDLIKPGVEASGFDLECQRSQARRGTFVKEIVEALKQSYVVVADLTGQRPNVFYELGVRHALSNRTILIARDLKFVPSDLREYATIIYGFPGAEAKRRFFSDIREVLGQIEVAPDEPDSPVGVYLQRRDWIASDVRREENLRKLLSLQAECKYNAEIAAETWTSEVDPLVALESFSRPSLQAFVSDFYIDHLELNEQARRIDGILEQVGRLTATGHSPKAKEAMLTATGLLRTFLINLILVTRAYKAELPIDDIELLSLTPSDEDYGKALTRLGINYSEDKHSFTLKIRFYYDPSQKSFTFESTRLKTKARNRKRTTIPLP
jgi:hypothetical protein